MKRDRQKEKQPKYVFPHQKMRFNATDTQIWGCKMGIENVKSWYKLKQDQDLENWAS